MGQDYFTSFLNADSKAWADVAKNELNGKNPFETLSYVRGGINVKPYYEASDTKNIAEDNLMPSADPYLGPRGWYNTPKIDVTDSSVANTKALEHLNNGADGILFNIQSTVVVEKLLANIKLPYCATFFQFENEQSTFLSDFEQYVGLNGFDKAQIIGSIFWDLPQTDLKISMNKFEGWNKFHALGICVATSSDPMVEISNALLAGVNAIEKQSQHGIDIKTAISQMAFSFNIGPDFFIEITKLKAFRKLWRQVTGAYQVVPNNELFIHACSPAWNDENYQPNANLLKSTTAAMSAILGGCNAITIEPENDGSAFKNRIARNVLTLLREESHLNQTADATAGSYYLETLVDEMAKEAWGNFQKEVKA